MSESQPTYDERQVLHARLVRCVTCGREWYMTKPAPVCLECQGAAVSPAR